MKHLFAPLFCLLALTLPSCKKDETTPPVQTPNFQITGLRDVDFSRVSGNNIDFDISVKSNPGTTDTVFLYANELPGGVSVSFAPTYGVTPFTSKVSVRSFASDGKTYTFQINGAGRSGLRKYVHNVVQPGLRGWQLGSDTYNRLRIEKASGAPSFFKCISDNGASLNVTFGPGEALPTSGRTYAISNDALSPGSVMLTFVRGHVTYYSSGNGSAVGTFDVNSEGKLNFKCTNVDMVDSTQNKSLTANFGE